MENKSTGYKVNKYSFETKRYCQTLDLKDDPHLISEYISKHSEEQFSEEIMEGMRKVGILDMDIYISGNKLFMIVETRLDFDWESAFKKLASLSGQQEWEDTVSVFQHAKEGASSSEKWQLMDRIFRIYK